MNHPTNKSINHPTNQPMNHPTNQPINHSTNQSTNHPSNQSTNQSMALTPSDPRVAICVGEARSSTVFEAEQLSGEAKHFERHAKHPMEAIEHGQRQRLPPLQPRPLPAALPNSVCTAPNSNGLINSVSSAHKTLSHTHTFEEHGIFYNGALSWCFTAYQNKKCDLMQTR